MTNETSDNLPAKIATGEVRPSTPLDRFKELVRNGSLTPRRMGHEVTLIARTEALPALAEMGIKTAGQTPLTKRALALAADEQVVSLADVAKTLGTSTSTITSLLERGLPTLTPMLGQSQGR